MKYAHLSAGFMLTSIIGFFIAIYYVMQLSVSWGVTFCIFFGMMFLSSMISMTKAPYSDKEYQEELAIHEKPSYKKPKKR